MAASGSTSAGVPTCQTDRNAWKEQENDRPQVEPTEILLVITGSNEAWSTVDKFVSRLLQDLRDSKTYGKDSGWKAEEVEANSVI